MFASSKPISRIGFDHIIIIFPCRKSSSRIFLSVHRMNAALCAQTTKKESNQPNHLSFCYRINESITVIIFRCKSVVDEFLSHSRLKVNFSSIRREHCLHELDTMNVARKIRLKLVFFFNQNDLHYGFCFCTGIRYGINQIY